MKGTVAIESLPQAFEIIKEMNSSPTEWELGDIELNIPRSVIQRCWAHKGRNVLSYVRKTDWQEVKKDLHKISYAKNLGKAQWR